MEKIISLIKVSLNHDMNIFKIHTKKQSNFIKFYLPLIFTLYIMFLSGAYSYKLMEMLESIHLEYMALSLFGIGVCLFTLIEGIYKSGSLLFNCKDDQLLFSMPIKKETIFFIRVLKFYIFELLFNSLFLLPVMIVYAYFLHPGFSYYIVSLVALVLLPIVPIVLSCLIGFIITYLSSMFKGKNFVQTIFTTIILLGVFYFCYNIDGLTTNLVKKATSVNEIVTKLYYPVGMYVTLVNDFNIKEFLAYIIGHIALLLASLYLLGKVYFKINSGYKRVLIDKKISKEYKIKTNKRVVAFVKKELNRFISTPVFITNAGFGLVLFILGCTFISIKYDSIVPNVLKAYPNMDIKSYMPVIMFGFVAFSSLMTSITSSMISLESKSINILKSLPIKPIKIVMYKVLAALVIMIPCLLIGDIIIFIRFKFDIVSIFLILISSILLPFVSELIGIMVNLKYPKMDATNDTEIVKQSMSSMISVFMGMGLLAITFFLLIKVIKKGLSNIIILSIFNGIYGLILLVLFIILIKTCDNSFNNIES